MSDYAVRSNAVSQNIAHRSIAYKLLIHDAGKRTRYSIVMHDVSNTNTVSVFIQVRARMLREVNKVDDDLFHDCASPDGVDSRSAR